MSTKTPTPRRYTNTRRTAQAAQTRADVVFAAVELFRERGYTATTLAAIAERAGVAVETVYNGFGSKKKLLRAAADVAVAGDTEPIPYIERPEVQSLRTGSQRQRIRTGMKILTDINERYAGVGNAILEAAASDAEVAGWCTELEAARKLDLHRSLEMIFEHEIADPAVDLLWALLGAEVFLKLRNEAGWTRDEYEQRMFDATTKLIPLLKP